MCYFSCKEQKKSPFLCFSRFRPDFQFLVKFKMADKMPTIADDVTGAPAVPSPVKYTSSCYFHSLNLRYSHCFCLLGLQTNFIKPEAVDVVL